MEISTIGFTQTTARDFFGRLRKAGIRRLIDVRLNNSSQLAGLAKRDDLAYFLEELCAAEYAHEPYEFSAETLCEGEIAGVGARVSGCAVLRSKSR